MKKISLKCTLVLLLFLATLAGIFCTPLNSMQMQEAYAASGMFASTEEEGFWSVMGEGEIAYALYTVSDIYAR